MKDKEKQIDEIAKLMCSYPQCVNYNKTGGCKIAKCQTVDRAENIYNAGYRKLPENARVFIPDGQMVVLSMEEVNELIKIKENCLELMKQGEQQIVNIRKETAEKIYNYADKFLFEDPTDSIYFKEYVKEEFGFDIKE